MPHEIPFTHLNSPQLRRTKIDQKEPILQYEYERKCRRTQGRLYRSHDDVRLKADDRYEIRTDRNNEYLDDFDEDEYYEDDYDYGDGLDNGIHHRVKSDSILDLHFTDDIDNFHPQHRSDSIMNIDFMDISDKSKLHLPTDLEKDLEFGDQSLQVDFEGYKDEISDYENEIIHEDLLASNLSIDKIDDNISSIIQPSVTLDRLSSIQFYPKPISSIYSSRNRLESLRNSEFLARRRVLSSDAVWLTSTPVYKKKCKSNDEMIKRRQVVRFK